MNTRNMVPKTTVFKIFLPKKLLAMITFVWSLVGVNSLNMIKEGPVSIKGLVTLLTWKVPFFIVNSIGVLIQRTLLS